MRLMRMTRMVKIKTIAALIESMVETKAEFLFAWTFIRILVVMFFITHVAGCIWYTVGQSAMHSYPPLPDGTPCSWILRFIPDYVTIPSERYVYSLHFALTTMTTVGYGDISPTNVPEFIVTQILLV